ncbi:hypothetical protein [Streptomyces sp. NBC_00162]|uniref:hypothetical protein n=1 Tax=Streptomyces sp. NBC_00162 TaxID=2903629 RepID=UPI00214A9935|nr:hypothetical protein [Streptomyces sp. NBC_00162]UUU37738.1 hypothetical protein JIW86_01740 [Streptomyces sp. NBC_00162]
MMPAGTLRFHGRAAQLAGLDLEISKEAEAVLDRFESVHGHVVPASVREWFTLAQGAAVLRKFSNDDMVYDAERLGREEIYYWPEDNGDWPDDVDEQEERPFDPVGSLGLLPFMVENQGVWVMAVRLDGSDDPPVVISFDDVTPSAAWQPHADRFSDLVHARIWDAPVHLHGKQLALPGAPEPSALLEVLRQDFTPGPPTVDGTQRHSRNDDRQRVLLEQWRGQWHATVWAADEAGLAALTAAVDPTTD